MKRGWILLLLVCFPWQALAQSDTADLRASCNASFHEGCKSITTSSGFAAPMGALGSSVLEGVLVAALIAGGIGRRLYRQAIEGKRKHSHHEGA
jgi:hypothetical protein